MVSSFPSQSSSFGTFCSQSEDGLSQIFDLCYSRNAGHLLMCLLVVWYLSREMWFPLLPIWHWAVAFRFILDLLPFPLQPFRLLHSDFQVLCVLSRCVCPSFLCFLLTFMTLGLTSGLKLSGLGQEGSRKGSTSFFCEWYLGFHVFPFTLIPFNSVCRAQYADLISVMFSPVAQMWHRSSSLGWAQNPTTYLNLM